MGQGDLQGQHPEPEHFVLFLSFPPCRLRALCKHRQRLRLTGTSRAALNKPRSEKMEKGDLWMLLSPRRRWEVDPHLPSLSLLRCKCNSIKSSFPSSPDAVMELEQPLLHGIMGIWRLCGIAEEERDAPLSAFPGIPSQLSAASGIWECFCCAGARAWLSLSRVGSARMENPKWDLSPSSSQEWGWKQEFPLGSWLSLSWIREIPKIQCRDGFGVWGFVRLIIRGF